MQQIIRSWDDVLEEILGTHVKGQHKYVCVCLPTEQLVDYINYLQVFK